jgi:twitching motility two-component system response regulator PilH
VAGETILVVDDSPTALRLAAAPLRAQGYRVLTAVDGEQALEAALRDRPDLIVLDIILPKKNGFQVCRQLKSTPETQDIKIVLLSSKSQSSDRFWGIQQGADRYITKPFADDELLAGVRELLAAGRAPATPRGEAPPAGA